MCRVFLDYLDGEYESKLKDAFGWVGLTKKVKPGEMVLLKPNLTYPRFKPGVTTTPQVLETTIKLLKDMGAKVVVGESDGGYNSYEVKDVFRNYGLYELAEKYGVKIKNFSSGHEKWKFISIRKYFKKFRVEYPVLLEECDHFITIPVPKVHAMTQISLSYKNQWGCIPNTMRLRYHPVFNEAIFAINQIPRSKYSIIDGTYGLTRNGPMVGDAFKWGWVMVSDSLEAADLVASRLMGVNLRKIKHYYLAFRNKLMPELEQIQLNQGCEKFMSNKFYLKRDIWNYLALFAWMHPWVNHFFYESGMAGLLHRIMYTFRKKPINN